MINKNCALSQAATMAHTMPASMHYIVKQWLYTMQCIEWLCFANIYKKCSPMQVRGWKRFDFLIVKMWFMIKLVNFDLFSLRYSKFESLWKFNSVFKANALNLIPYSRKVKPIRCQFPIGRICTAVCPNARPYPIHGLISILSRVKQLAGFATVSLCFPDLISSLNRDLLSTKSDWPGPPAGSRS